ncbi:hypothetical protein ACVW00_003235 [Marmoricola sp. URHA0025 HA25]
MEIQVRTDRHVKGDDELIAFVASTVVTGLGPCAARVMSAHVHLTAERISRVGPPELRCLLEVRPRGHAPLAVTHGASTKDDAVRGAAADMRGVLERMFERIDARHPGADTIRRPA